MGMGTGTYSPFDHLDAKGMWDDAIQSRGVEADKWLYTADTIVGQWFIQKWLNTKEFVDAKDEIKALCQGIGLNHLCLGCSSRATKHICSECESKNKGSISE